MSIRRTRSVGFPAILSWSLAIGCAATLLGACNAGDAFTEPWVVAQPDSVMVTLGAGSGATLSRTVTVTNAGPGALTALDAAIAYRDRQHGGWLSAELSSTTAPTTLALQASAGSLAAGAYEATVVVRAPDAANDSAVVHVVCSVTLPQCTMPVMCLSSTRLTFAAEAGSAPPAQPVGVFSCGCGRVTGLHTSVAYEERELPDWLSVKKNAWRTPAALSVQVSTVGLLPGSYHGRVVVTADVAANSPQTIEVALDLAPPIGAGPAVRH